MKNEVKCYRCGTKFKLAFKTIEQEVKCPHCQGVMTFDKKTKIWFNIFKYIFIFLVSISLILLINIFTSSIWIVLLVALLISFVVVSAADKIGEWMVYLTVGAKYIHVETEKEIKKREKEEKKENNKKK